jgi:hypothetical protein
LRGGLFYCEARLLRPHLGAPHRMIGEELLLADVYRAVQDANRGLEPIIDRVAEPGAERPGPSSCIQVRFQCRCSCCGSLRFNFSCGLRAPGAASRAS